MNEENFSDFSNFFHFSNFNLGQSVFNVNSLSQNTKMHFQSLIRHFQLQMRFKVKGVRDKFDSSKNFKRAKQCPPVNRNHVNLLGKSILFLDATGYFFTLLLCLNVCSLSGPFGPQDDLASINLFSRKFLLLQFSSSFDFSSFFLSSMLDK